MGRAAAAPGGKPARHRRIRAAEAAYRRVLEVNPRRAEALIALAGLLIVRAEGGEARTLLIRCLGIAPTGRRPGRRWALPCC